MRRHSIAPRANWQRKVEELGLIWHSVDGRPYWDESAYYAFTSGQVAEIEAATAELYRLFLAAGQAVIDRDLFRFFGIPAHVVPAIRAAWDAEPPALNFGRFDLGYDGKGPPKLFEFNCDTPTSLLEAAVIQWDWKEALFPERDQFTSLHERLVAKWVDIAPLLPETVHFAHVGDDAGEDTVTVAYLRDTAAAAGITSRPILMPDIGWDQDANEFVDEDGNAMSAIFHLYPWEWLVHEQFGAQLVGSLPGTIWIEPIWKMIWSNKAVLPLLWEMFPDHPNLLPAFFEPFGKSYVRKPLMAREGANVTIMKDGAALAATDGDYGEEGFVYQVLFDLPGTGDCRPVIGSWIVDGEPAGMGIREDGLITGNGARFMPHIIEDAIAPE